MADSPTFTRVFLFRMPTVHQQVTNHCANNNLPFPPASDLSQIGQAIGYNFRHVWAVNQTKEILDQARFVFSYEKNCKPFIVINYPESYTPEIDRIVKTYYDKKIAAMPQIKNQTAVKKRTRKPINKPEMSVKPSEKIQ